jgi:hypothetical protein
VTSKTPAQVAEAAARAQAKMGCAYLFFIALLWVAIEIFLPGLAVALRDMIGALLFGN